MSQLEGRGSCICGEAAFTFSGERTAFYLCHCSRCRKGSGSAHSANLFIKNATLNWTKGQELATTYQLPETRFARTFCQACGGSLPTTMKPDHFCIPVGCLDTPLAERPNAHIFCESRADWDHDLEQVEQLPGLPGR